MGTEHLDRLPRSAQEPSGDSPRDVTQLKATHLPAYLPAGPPQGYFGRLIFLYAYLAVCVPLLAWFVAYTWCCWTDLSF